VASVVKSALLVLYALMVAVHALAIVQKPSVMVHVVSVQPIVIVPPENSV